MISLTVYPIVEIFHSVQGEGFHAGIPHVFVRFGNCNLRCEWCDTDFLTYKEMDVDEIVDEVLSFGCERVIFTGGEPAMQDGPPALLLNKQTIQIGIGTYRLDG